MKLGPRELAQRAQREKNSGSVEAPEQLAAKLSTVQPRDVSRTVSELAAALGRRGGLARATALSSERAKEIASLGGKSGGRGRKKS